MEKYNLKNKTDIKMHNVLFAITRNDCGFEERLLLLENMPNANCDEFILVEGYHCSCYDFDETKWECTQLTKKELNKLLENVKDYEILRKKLKEFLTRY